MIKLDSLKLQWEFVLFPFLLSDIPPHTYYIIMIWRFIKYQAINNCAFQWTGCPCAASSFDVNVCSVLACACFDLVYQSLCGFLLFFSLPSSFCAADVIVHCVWGWTWTNPWTRIRGEHLSGTKITILNELMSRCLIDRRLRATRLYWNTLAWGETDQQVPRVLQGAGFRFHSVWHRLFLFSTIWSSYLVPL